MEPAAEAEFPRDHNVRAMDQEALEAIKAELEAFGARRDQIIASADKFVQIRDRIDVGKATDIVGIGQRVGALVEAERKKLVAPHNEAARVVNDYVTTFWQPALNALTALTERIEIFSREEDAKIQSQREEQAAHEAALRSTAPSTSAPAPLPAANRTVRGDYGFAARRRPIDVIEIEDVRALPDWVFQSQPVIDAIIATVKALVSKKITIPGLKVTQTTRTRVGK